MRYMALFKDLSSSDLTLAGGKGAALARLYQKGFNVPDGCVIFPHSFDNDSLVTAATSELKNTLAYLGKDKLELRLAIRSSGIGEDSAQSSFAGSFLSVLNVEANLPDILSAICSVRRSAFTQRADTYMASQGIDGHLEMAVIVQVMVQPELSGVLFTRDPLSNSSLTMAGNYIVGLGENLVSGEANAETFAIDRRLGKLAGGACLKPYARTLHDVGLRLENELAGPQDVEWAISSNQVYILQSRPITTISSFNWYDGFDSKYLWSCGNAAEALPEVLTPFSWSLWKVFHRDLSPIKLPEVGEFVALVGGRAYFNFSLIYSLSHLKQSATDALRSTEELLGKLPPGTTVTPVSIPKPALLRIFFANLRWERHYRKLLKDIPAYLARVPNWCRSTAKDIDAASTTLELKHLWEETINPELRQSFLLVRASAKQFFDLTTPLSARLEKLVGSEHATILLSNLRGCDDTGLASLGPLLGLAALAQGKITPLCYTELYGHRGPNEAEIAAPRPYEAPHWLDSTLENFGSSAVKVDDLLSKQQQEYEQSLKLLLDKEPSRANRWTDELKKAAQAAQMREAIRSECIRVLGVVRRFTLKAGQLTGCGENIFYLTKEELLASLTGTSISAGSIKRERKSHTAFKALPPYPTFVRGQFEPAIWAANPNRRNDIADNHIDMPLTADTSQIIKGYPGSSGIVEGRVRILHSPDEAQTLIPGEILVAKTTNIGWTLLFPQVSAIITDVGAPLSHAAIVARELGIPAVLGCGVATTRLKTGDKVRVNGASGEVLILDYEGSR